MFTLTILKQRKCSFNTKFGPAAISLSIMYIVLFGKKPATHLPTKNLKHMVDQHHHQLRIHDTWPKPLIYFSGDIPNNMLRPCCDHVKGGCLFHQHFLIFEFVYKLRRDSEYIHRSSNSAASSTSESLLCQNIQNPSHRKQH